MIFNIVNENIYKNLLKELEHLPTDGKYTVEIKEVKRKRTLAQNSLWYKWLGIIVKETGNDIQDIKNQLKWEAWGTDAIIQAKVFGLDSIRIKSSTEAKVKEMGKLLDATNMFAIKNNIRLPQPEYYGY